MDENIPEEKQPDVEVKQDTTGSEYVDVKAAPVDVPFEEDIFKKAKQEELKDDAQKEQEKGNEQSAEQNAEQHTERRKYSILAPVITAVWNTIGVRKGYAPITSEQFMELNNGYAPVERKYMDALEKYDEELLALGTSVKIFLPKIMEKKMNDKPQGEA